MENTAQRLGAYVKKRRKEMGLSQIEFAKSAKTTQSQLSFIERGEFNLTTNTVDSLCKAMNIPFSIVYFSMMVESDVPEHKRDVFRRLKPVMDNMIKEFY